MIAWSSPPTFPTWTQSTQRRWSASFTYPLEKKTKGKFCGTTAQRITALRANSNFFGRRDRYSLFTESDFMVHKVLFITIVALVGVFLSQRAAAAEPTQKVR